MNNPIVFMFSGQGSQYYSMGRELYENNDVFHYWMNHCSKMAEQFIDLSLVDLIYRKRANRFESFDKTVYTHPAIFIVEYSLSQVMVELGIKAEYLLGYSIGEYIANVLAGVMSLEEGLSTIHKNASLIDTLTPDAGMLAILASPTITDRFREEFSGISVAGVNFDTHFVVTSDFGRLEHLKQFLDKQNITSQMLPVTHGFHSYLMDSIEQDFKKHMESISFGSIQTPIISPTYMRQLQLEDIVADYFYKIVRQPVKFRSTIERWEQTGNFTYIDVGPAGTLTTFVKQIIKNHSTDSKAFTSLNMFGKDLDSIRQLQASLELMQS